MFTHPAFSMRHAPIGILASRVSYYHSVLQAVTAHRLAHLMPTGRCGLCSPDFKGSGVPGSGTAMFNRDDCRDSESRASSVAIRGDWQLFARSCGRAKRHESQV
jgi:hypothetical protein